MLLEPKRRRKKEMVGEGERFSLGVERRSCRLGTKEDVSQINRWIGFVRVIACRWGSEGLNVRWKVAARQDVIAAVSCVFPVISAK